MVRAPLLETVRVSLNRGLGHSGDNQKEVQSGPAPHLLSGSSCTESLTGPHRSAAGRFAQKFNSGPDSGSTAE